MRKTIVILTFLLSTSAYAEIKLKDLNPINEPSHSRDYVIKKDVSHNPHNRTLVFEDKYEVRKPKVEVATEEFRFLLEYGQSASFHPMADTNISKNFKNKLNSNGLWVQNPRYMASGFWIEGDTYQKVSGLVTRDCLDQASFGATYSSGVISDGRWAYAGFIAGGYVIQTQAWRDIRVDRYWLVDVNNKTGIVPLLGFEFNLSLIKTKHLEINFHNFVSPVLTNHALTLGIGF